MLILALALSAAATTSETPPATAPAHTLQQDFDAASAAAAEGKCGDAVTLFEALEKDPRLKAGSLPAAAVAVRKGQCLVKLGRYSEGEASIAAGLPKVKEAGESFAGDYYDAQMSLGMVAFHDYDFAAARQHYEAALAPAKGVSRLPALAVLAKITAYDGTNAALAYAEEAMQIIDAEPGDNKKLRSGFMTLHARALLDKGQNKPAYDELKQALKLSGGLTTKVNLDEISMRGDLAMAALLVGKRDDAHLYLAYTGAGRIAESPFSRAQMMDVPVCGSETGLQPQDEAVVEFAIAPDGRVSSAQTVFTRGGPEVAKAFSDAVRQWYWDPETLAKIPAFYLAATRVELRCSRAGGDAPGVIAPLAERFNGWAAKQLGSISAAGDEPPVAELQQVLAAPETKADPARFVAAASWLASSRALTFAGRKSLVEQALGTARTASLPADVITSLVVYQGIYASPLWTQDFRPKRDMPIYAQSLFDLAAKPEIAGDPMAAATLRLTGARLAPWLKDPARIVPQLKLVADDASLGDASPLRQVANLQLADLAAQAHDLEAAHTYFQRTGLTEEQCSLLGVQPALRSSHVSSNDYPSQAAAMGFEGWARVEFDIKTDGHTVGGRTVIAYPAFVFSDGAEEMSKDFVYQTTYRPSANMACSAQQEGIVFRMN